MVDDKVQQIESKARGNWKNILMNLGIPADILTEKEGICFSCGGKTRARWIPDKEYYFCSHCVRSRNGFQMLRDYMGITFPEAVDLLSKYLGITNRQITTAEINKHKKAKRHKQYIRAKMIHGCASGSLKAGIKLTDDDIELWDKAIRYIQFFDKTYPQSGQQLPFIG